MVSRGHEPGPRLELILAKKRPLYLQSVWAGVQIP
jgi:hypothetical protein